LRQTLTSKYTFTVFTPTFNRAHTLARVFRSLQAQSFRDFEWLVIDDGSSDGTEALVKSWKRSAGFPVRYLGQDNVGKPRTVNRGVQEARGDLFLTLDSDDACVPFALERFKFHWDAIPEHQKKDFTGVASLAQDPHGKVIGTPFPFDVTDSNSLEIRLKYKITGEKWGFHRTEILRRFPNPEMQGERYITESVIWNRIALHYKIRYVNEALRIYFPSHNGLTSTPARIKNCKSARFYYREFVALDYPIPQGPLLRAYANYVRYSWHSGAGISAQASDAPSRIRWLAAFPVGSLLYLRDKSRFRTVQEHL
jgi:glycosyltransferase involved in cell wall biosynthesis